MPTNRWAKVAIVALFGLLSVALRWPFGDDSLGPQTYTNREWGFTMTHDGSLTELPLDVSTRDKTMLWPDVEVGFFDATGPRIGDDSAADGITVGLFEIGDPVPKEDPRLDNIGTMLLTVLEDTGNTDVGEAREVAMEGCRAAAEVESTDPYGRHAVDRVGVVGTRLHWVTASATAETNDDIRPLLTEAVATFAVTEVERFSTSPRTYVDPEKTVALTCDRRFARVPAGEGGAGVSMTLALGRPSLRLGCERAVPGRDQRGERGPRPSADTGRASGHRP